MFQAIPSKTLKKMAVIVGLTAAALVSLASLPSNTATARGYGDASSYSARHVTYKWVVRYEEQTVPYKTWVVRYDHCGAAYRVPVVRYRVVSVPVKTRVAVYY